MFRWNCNLRLQRNLFWKVFWRKLVHFNLFLEVPIKENSKKRAVFFSAGMSKLYSSCPELNSFGTWAKKFGISMEVFRQCCESNFCVSRGLFWRKLCICEKIQFISISNKSWYFLGGSSICLQRFRQIFRGKVVCFWKNHKNLATFGL